MSDPQQPQSGERLLGVRVPFGETPQGIRSWAQEVLGAPVVDVVRRSG